MKITILKSKENLVWVSMNEIIPWIIRLWERWGRERGHEVQVIDVDGRSPATLFPVLFQSDLVVITSFTTSIARLIYLAMGRLGIPIRCAFYLHNQATIACWPLFEWKMGEALSTHDVFVGSCERDRISMEACFENAVTKVHPFSLPEFSEDVTPPPATEAVDFVFIGRISPQKNLHTLLWSLYLLKLEEPELRWTMTFYGGEDHYGAPLMGIGDNEYQKFLTEIVRWLKLTDRVQFRGFQDRELIQKELDTHQRIFVVPSLHSDENFGMAAFRCLSQGHKVVLSDWGGHGDYRRHFPDNLFLVPVRESKMGPVVDSIELTNALLRAAKTRVDHRKNSGHYHDRELFRSLDDITSPGNGKPEKLRRSALGTRIHEKWRKFNDLEKAEIQDDGKRIRGCRIFEDFFDPDSFALFRAYGMGLPLRERTGPVIRAPWVFPTPDHLKVHDPMKGVTLLPYTTKSEEDQWLYEHGYASPLED